MLSDITFGISRINTVNQSVVSPRSDIITDGFLYQNNSKILQDIINNTTILTGSRISSSGTNSSDDNFIEIDLTASYILQYYTPTTFSAVIILTISSGQI